MTGLLKDVYNYFFNNSIQKQETQEHCNRHQNLVDKQPKKIEQQFKKNDGYKNVNSSKLLDIVFNPIDI